MGNDRRIVVTGLGLATPIGIGVDVFWDALLSGQSGIARIVAFDPSGFDSQIAGELPEFKLTDFIPKRYRKSVKVMSRDITVAMIAAYHAVIDAGLKTLCIIERGEAEGEPNVDSTRFGANIGAGLVCADLTELAAALITAVEDGRFSLKKWGAEGMQNLTPLWLLKFLPNMLACHVTIVHDAQAPCNTIPCGEASSHLAIGEAYRTLQRGAADVCICGGAESKANPTALATPQVLERLNTKSNDAPASASRPFTETSTGSVIAEGGGLVILETLDHARARNARIYAEVVGFGSSTNAMSWSAPDPSGRGYALSIRRALADADIAADAIDLIGAFGTGIRDYDAAEAKAWSDVFGDALPETSALTTRGGIGVCGAGAGAIDFAAVTLALYHNTVPPSINTSPPMTDCRLRFESDGPADARIRAAITLGHAIDGGQSAALVIRGFEE